MAVLKDPEAYVPPVDETVDDLDQEELDMEEGEEGESDSDDDDDEDEAPAPKSGKSKSRNSELEATRRELAEAKEAARFWAEQAKGGKSKKTAAADEEDGEDDPLAELLAGDTEDPEDNVDKFTDELTTNGIEALRKRGILTKKDVIPLILKVSQQISEKTLARERKKLESDGQLYQAFPELADPKSDLSTLTAKYFQEAIADDPTVGKSHAVIRMAAARAKAEISAKQRREDRIKAQTGGYSFATGEADNEDLSPLQRRMAKQYGVTEKEYKRQLKAMQMKGTR